MQQTIASSVIIPYTPEWFASRIGKVTGSRVADATSNPRTKGGESATRNTYKDQLVAERLTGISHSPDIGYLPHIKWGKKYEPEAISLLEYMHDIEVSPSLSFNHPRIAMTSATPDGVLPSNGVLEAKCPNTSTHMAYIRAGVVPTAYRKQMMLQMACTGMDWGNFVSYDPRMNQFENKLLVVHFMPSRSEIEELEEKVQEFLYEVSVETNWFMDRGVTPKNIRKAT